MSEFCWHPHQFLTIWSPVFVGYLVTGSRGLVQCLRAEKWNKADVFPAITSWCNCSCLYGSKYGGHGIQQ